MSREKNEKKKQHRSEKRQKRLDAAPKKNVVILYSGDAENIKHLKEYDPNYGFRYAFTAAFTDNNQASGTDYLESIYIPCICLDWEHFWKTTKGDNDAYFEQLAASIEEYNPAFIVLSEFTRELPDWFVRKFEWKLIIVQLGDLSVYDINTRKRLYQGESWDVMRAILQQDKLEETRSTVCFITDAKNESPIIAFSRSCRIISKDTVKTLHTRLKDHCGHEALKRALEKLVNWQWPATLLPYSHFEEY